NNSLRDAMWDGDLNICLFVFNEEAIWVVDDKVNYSLDAEKDYRAYLERGDITNSQYEAACKEFRGGVLRLDSENFDYYLKNTSAKVLSTNDLGELFFDSACGTGDGLLDELEGHYTSGRDISAGHFKRINMLASRLPSFYINFDRHIFMHLDGSRFHEDLAHGGWVSKRGDFEFLIPDSHRYWVRKSRSYWKVRFLSG
ncbi:hypothetical protein, partial [Xanthomonas hortorum]